MAAEGEGVLLLQPSLDRLLQLWWQPHWRLLPGGKLRVLVRMLAGLRLQASADRQAGRQALQSLCKQVDQQRSGDVQAQHMTAIAMTQWQAVLRQQQQEGQRAQYMSSTAPVRPPMLIWPPPWQVPAGRSGSQLGPPRGPTADGFLAAASLR